MQIKGNHQQTFMVDASNVMPQQSYVKRTEQENPWNTSSINNRTYNNMKENFPTKWFSE